MGVPTVEEDVEYVEQTWVDAADPTNPPDGALPMAAANLNTLERGVRIASQVARVARTALNGRTSGQLLDRANHTGSQTSGSISDFTEAVQDTVAGLLAAGTGVSVSYDDTAGTLTLTSTASGGTGGTTDPEVVRDTIGVALAGVGAITVQVNDAGDTITISTTATANSTDAQLRDRATHTGNQAASTISDLVEVTQDTVAAMVTAGSGLSKSYDDVAGTLTLAVASAVAAVTRTPEQHGAVGDGVTDDQAAWVALLAALQPGERVYCAPGKVYAHSGKLELVDADVEVAMTGARLRATNPNLSAFVVTSTANRVHLLDFTHESPNTTLRNNSNFDSGLLVVAQNTGARLTRPRTIGSAGCGLFLFGPSGFVVDHPVVDRSWADGVHMTQGARDGVVIAPTVNRSGDDGVAVVSYDGDTAQCRNIVVTSPKVSHCHARGVSILGGINVVYHDVDVAFTRAAGAAIMAEYSPDPQGFRTKQSARSAIRGGRVRHTNYPVSSAGDTGATDSPLDHGALLLFNDRPDPMVECVISDVTVEDIGPGSQYDITRAIVQNGGTFTTCAIRRITVGPGCPPFGINIGANGAAQVDGAATFVYPAVTLQSSTLTGSKTLTAADAGKVLQNESANAYVVTLPSTGVPIGTVVELYQQGTGGLSVAAGAGAVVEAAGGLATRARYSTLSVRQRTLGTWVVSGDTT